jgi:hypothetical protein
VVIAVGTVCWKLGLITSMLGALVEARTDVLCPAADAHMNIIVVQHTV